MKIGWRLAPGSRLPFEPKASSYEVRTRRSVFNFLTYDSNYASTVFYFSALIKARTLLEAMAGSAKKTHTADIPGVLKTAEEALLRELSYLDRRWEEASKKGEKAIKDWQQRREGLKKHIDELINILRKNYPRYAALHYPLPVKAEELPLKENEVLFEYAVTDVATYLFVVRKGGVQKAIKIDVGRENLEKNGLKT